MVLGDILTWDGSENFSWLCLYSVPKWTKNKKTCNSVESKFGDTLKESETSVLVTVAKWQPSPVFLPGESQGWGSLVGCRLWGLTESDTLKQLSRSSSSLIIKYLSNTEARTKCLWAHLG